MIVILAVVQEMVARLGVVSGQGLSDLIRDRFGVRWTAFAMLVLLVANVAQTITEFAGVSAAGSVVGIPPILLVPASAVALWALVLFASRKTVERVFMIAVAVFALYIVSAIIAHPDWREVGQALVTPSMPTDPATLFLVIALVGTTITPFMQFYLQSAVAEKGIGVDELPLERADAVIGSVWTNVIAVFIVIAVAGTLFVSGITVETAADAAAALEPVAGQLASVIFAVGLFGASMLAATILPVTTAFVICEAFGWESGVGKRFRDAPAFFGIFTSLLVIGALVVLIPGLDLIPLIIGTQYLQGLLLPIVLAFIVLLVNDRRLMGTYANGRALNVLAWGCVALVVILDLVLLASAAAEAIP
jgi:Mn2+/Fe2+ NRAMP family transporter